MRIPKWAKKLGTYLGYVGRVKLLLTFATSGVLTSALLSVTQFFRAMPPVLQVVTWICLALIVCAVLLYAMELVSSPPEGRARLQPRYEPYDRLAGAPKHERVHGFGSVDYLIGVLNNGPSVARNVTVRVMDVYSNVGDGGPARITGLYPRLCRRAETSDDERLINPGGEALYHIGRIRDLAKESGFKGYPRTPAFWFDWPTGGWGPSSVVGEKTHRITFHFEITAENADPVRCKLVFRGETSEEGQRFFGELTQ